MTNSADCKVIIEGVRANTDSAELEAKLNAAIRTTPARIRQLLANLQAGKSAEVKQTMARPLAEQLCQQLNDLGLICRVTEELTLVPMQQEWRCPSCGCMQLRSGTGIDRCEQCGIVLQGYEEKATSLAFDPYTVTRLEPADGKARPKEKAEGEIQDEKAQQRSQTLFKILTDSPTKVAAGLSKLDFLGRLTGWFANGRARLRHRVATASVSYKVFASVLFIGIVLGCYALYRHMQNLAGVDVIELGRRTAASSAPPAPATAAAKPPSNPPTGPANVGAGSPDSPAASQPTPAAKRTPETTDNRPIEQTWLGIVRTFRTVSPAGSGATPATPNGSQQPQPAETGTTEPPPVSLFTSLEAMLNIISDLVAVDRIEQAQLELERIVSRLGDDQGQQRLQKQDAVAFARARILSGQSQRRFQQKEAGVAQLLADAGQAARTIQTPLLRAQALSLLAADMVSVDAAQADRLFAEALETVEKRGGVLEQVEIGVRVARRRLEAGDAQGGRQLFNQLRARIGELSDPVQRLGALGLLAYSRAEIGDALLAGQLLEDAQMQMAALSNGADRTRAQQRLQRLQAETHGALARNRWRQGEREIGQELFVLAYQEAQLLTDPLERAVAASAIARQLAQADEDNLSRQVFSGALADVREGATAVTDNPATLDAPARRAP